MRRLFLVVFALFSALALGHVSIISGPGIANATQELTFGVGHGCAGNDTSMVRTTIPAGVTSVRAMTSDFGRATVGVDGTGAPTSVTWQRATADLLPVDTNFYKLTLRVKLPNTPFQVLYFPTEQTCVQADGGTLTSSWTDTSGLPPDGGTQEPSPAVVIVPAHKPGWNKLTMPVAVENLGVFFSDAQIVWRGNAAYSASSTTTELIAGTAGVTSLSALAAGDEIWVKY